MKENQRVAISKRMLKDALLRLLEHKAIQQITIAELCRKSGVNRTTFYRHYDTPNAILEEIHADQIEAIQAMLDGSPGQREERVHIVYRYLFEHRALFCLIMKDNDNRVQMSAQRMLMNERVRAWIRERMPFLPEQLLATFISAGLWVSTYQWLSAKDPISPDRMADYAITTMRGREEFISAAKP